MLSLCNRTLKGRTAQAFDKDVLARVKDVQLFTIAHHQAHIDNPDEGLWSWFDVVILESEESTAPKVKNGRSCIWLSHEIPAVHDGYTGQNGIMFDRQHDMLNMLEVCWISLRLLTKFMY
jgi:hypothetical protein